MKFFKSILIAIVFLLISSVGVFAQPAAYINEQGAVTPMPTGNTVKVEAIPSETEEENTLNFGAAPGQGTTTNPEQWYYIADSTSDEEDQTPTIALPPATGSDGADTGTLNIVVGPNDTNIAQINTKEGPWTIGNNQTINIYRAATPSNNDITLDQCYLTVANMSNTTGNAITVSSGGKLNAVSAALNCVGIIAPSTDSQSVAKGGYGIAIAGGQVTVNENAQLQCAVSTNQGAVQNVDGLLITSGSLTNSGYLRVIQNLTTFTENTGTSSGYASAGINNTAGTSGLSIDGGTVFTSTNYSSDLASYPSNSGLVWLQQTPTVTTDADVGTVSITGSAYGNATLNLGIYSKLTCLGANTFTVDSGANFTIPNGLTLNFGINPASAGTDGTLTVQSNGQLTIEESATVNMNSNSKLVNNGTITVETQTSPSTNS